MSPDAKDDQRISPGEALYEGFRPDLEEKKVTGSGSMDPGPQWAGKVATATRPVLISMKNKISSKNIKNQKSYVEKTFRFFRFFFRFFLLSLVGPFT